MLLVKLRVRLRVSVSVRVRISVRKIRILHVGRLHPHIRILPFYRDCVDAAPLGKIIPRVLS